jgi:hypothetical protein
MLFADTPDALAASPIFMAKLLLAAGEGHEGSPSQEGQGIKEVPLGLELEGTTADRDFRVWSHVVGSRLWT